MSTVLQYYLRCRPLVHYRASGVQQSTSIFLSFENTIPSFAPIITKQLADQSTRSTQPQCRPVVASLRFPVFQFLPPPRWVGLCGRACGIFKVWCLSRPLTLRGCPKQPDLYEAASDSRPRPANRGPPQTSLMSRTTPQGDRTGFHCAATSHPSNVEMMGLGRLMLTGSGEPLRSGVVARWHGMLGALGIEVYALKRFVLVLQRNPPARNGRPLSRVDRDMLSRIPGARSSPALTTAAGCSVR